MPELAAVAAIVVAVVGVVVQRWGLAAAALGLAAVAAVTARHGADHRTFVNGLTVVVFLEAMVRVAAAAERSGLLAWLAAGAGRMRSRPRLLLLGCFLAGVAVTVTLNLDTTAVLFTPLAVAIGRVAGQPAAPFALSSVLAANFGSVLLPSSNLTNLVVWRSAGGSFAAFVVHLAPLALVAVLISATALVAAGGRHLRHAHVAADHAIEPSSTAFPSGSLARVSAITIVVVLVALSVGAPPAPTAVIGAAVVLVTSRSLWASRLPLALLASLLALFGASAVLAASHRIDRLIAHVDSVPRLALAGTIGAAAVTNLAAVAVLAPLAATVAHQRALLSGVDLGVGLTPVGSLATILWRDALRRSGTEVPMRAYLTIGIPLSVILVTAGILLA